MLIRNESGAIPGAALYIINLFNRKIGDFRKNFDRKYRETILSVEIFTILVYQKLLHTYSTPSAFT